MMIQRLDVSEIIKCLDRVAAILVAKPEEALKEIKKISAQVDRCIPYRDGHMARVAAYSLLISRELGSPPDELVKVEAAALLHDFGKIGVDESFLIKSGPLTKKERAEIEKHVLRGYHILSGFWEFEDILEGIKDHHEHYDGSGYPEGRTEENISLIGRIIAVADAYDAISMTRPYRKARSKSAAIRELKRCAGSQFDPYVVKVFVKIIKRC